MKKKQKHIVIMTSKTHGNSMELKNQEEQFKQKMIYNFIACKSYWCLYNK